ncbi:MAG: glycyl-radical enzyme activating protein [Bacteroidales bacterium]|jgi:pyruvate formate lyase activating enzyme
MGKLTETEGIIFKIKRFSVHDGPGIRTSVFLKGCPLSCIWCHSPEGISSEISVWYDQSLCIACGECVKSCTEKALELVPQPEPKSQPHISINRKLCSLNGDCVKICPTGALQFTGAKTSIYDIINEIEKDILYYQLSGGGVTLTGGEPLYQPDFSGNILKECRKKNIHTAIETCLFCERETINNISDYVDLFIIDIKIFDKTQHICYTGKSNDIIKENLRYISGKGIPIIVRIPMIKGITDTEMNKNTCARFVNDIDKRIPIEYISYNPLAGNNYKRLEIPYLFK